MFRPRLSDSPKYRIVSVLALFIQPILVNIERIKELATNKNGNKRKCKEDQYTKYLVNIGKRMNLQMPKSSFKK